MLKGHFQGQNTVEDCFFPEIIHPSAHFGVLVTEWYLKPGSCSLLKIEY